MNCEGNCKMVTCINTCSYFRCWSLHFTREKLHISHFVKSLSIHICRLKLLKMFHSFWFCLCLWHLIGEFKCVFMTSVVSVLGPYMK